LAGVIILSLKQSESIAAERKDRANKLLAGPPVKVIKAAQTTTGHELTLIAEVRPFQSVTLYAKTSGYLEQILVDKGDKVTKGQLIGTITAPYVTAAK
jgi:multidrug efflux pump subunit AcrA (membrane-fusion protein)